MSVSNEQARAELLELLRSSPDPTCQRLRALTEDLPGPWRADLFEALVDFLSSDCIWDFTCQHLPSSTKPPQAP